MSNKRGELLESKAALDGALAAVKKQVKAAQKRLRSQWRFPKLAQRVALILYDKGGHDPAAAAADFLAKEAQKRQWPAKPEAEVRRIPQDWFLEIDINDFNDLCDSASPSDPGAMRLAMQFWQEWSLAAWVEDANFSKGVAPSTAIVLDRYEQLRLDVPEAARPAARGVVAQGKARAWALRFRNRWGLKHGAIPAVDDVPVQEMNQKARVQYKRKAALYIQSRSRGPGGSSLLA